MAKVLANVYFLHEDEEAEARRVVEDDPERIVAGGYVHGLVDELELIELESRGVAVERVAAGDPAWDEYRSGAVDRSGLAGGDFRGTPVPPQLEPDELASWAILVRGPLVGDRLEALTGLGLEIIERVSQSGCIVRGTSDQANEALLLPFVAELRRANPTTEFTPAPTSTDDARVLRGDPSVLGIFDVILDGSTPADGIADALRSRGVDVTAVGKRRIQMQAPDNDPLVADPHAVPGILGVSAHVEPELLNDFARALTGVDVGAPHALGALDGAGEIVAVTDTGIDETHPDLASQILEVRAHGRSGDATDPSGHGTHVAGTILGTGDASNGQIRGIAPGAQVVFQSVLDQRGYLTGLRRGVYELLDEAYQLGARIHNHSWGSLAESEYKADSLEMDAFVWEHPDCLMVVAAGNDGAADSPINAPSGYVDLFSLRAPATAKNVLTMGASSSSRTNGPSASRNWADYSNRRFPSSGAVGQTPMSGDPDTLAGFSSRGPCRDHRIKPDAVAPGTDVLSTRSSTAPTGTPFWGEYAPNGKYAYMGGTSMAAPVATGLALLVRQWFVSQGHQPSAALLKATLLNGCKWLPGSDAVSSHGNAPNFDQGFGFLYLPTTLPLAAPDSPKELLFVDTLSTPALAFHSERDRPIQIGVNVNGPEQPLRVTLCFTDPPGRAAQNDLALIVEQPDRIKVFGNENRRALFAGPDADNMVESVQIADPRPGDYLIQVVAKNILKGPQGFAVVITGDLDGTMDLGRH